MENMYFCILYCSPWLSNRVAWRSGHMAGLCCLSYTHTVPPMLSSWLLSQSVIICVCETICSSMANNRYSVSICQKTSGKLSFLNLTLPIGNLEILMVPTSLITVRITWETECATRGIARGMLKAGLSIFCSTPFLVELWAHLPAQNPGSAHRQLV